MNYRILLVIFLFSTAVQSKSLLFKEQVNPTLGNLIQDSFELDLLTKEEEKSLNLLFSKNLKNQDFIIDQYYKYILNYAERIKKGYKVVDQRMYNEIHKRANNLKLESIRSLYASLNKDLAEILTSSDYRNYKNTALVNDVRNQSVQVIRKKVSLISPWIRLLLENDPEQFELKTAEFIDQAKTHILKLMILLDRSNPHEVETKELFYYSDDRLEKAKEYIDILDFKIAPKPDPNYQEPENLPQPAQDKWVPVDETIIEDGAPLTKDQLFPASNPNYTPPKTLPKPVKKW